MKRLIVCLILMGFFSGGTVFFRQEYVKLLNNNKELYEEFEENGVVDVDGEINLSNLEVEHNKLDEELKVLFEQNNFDKDIYLKRIEEKKNSNVQLKNEMEKLSGDINNLESQKKELSNQYNVLNNKYKQLKNALSTSVSNSNGFPLINQYPTYPTGCESVALTMLLRYYGVSVMPNSIISALKKESLPYFEEGVKYGGNPEVGFVGNPYSSYGVYERPMGEVANKYKNGVQVRNNFSFDEVLNLVKNNHPVMVWVSMGLRVPYISDSWIYKPTMETISWKAGEHAVVVVSYSDGDTLVVADPIGGKLKSYSKSLFEARYNYYGRKALYYL